MSSKYAGSSQRVPAENIGLFVRIGALIRSNSTRSLTLDIFLYDTGHNIRYTRRDELSMQKNVTVTLTVDDRRITLEGPEDFVRSEVRRFAGLEPQPAKANGTIPSATGMLSERDLIAQKRPRNQTEIVAVLGFCLSANGLTEFREEDIKKAYLRAGVRPPKVIAQALRDARNKFDFIEAGAKKGTYRLSTHGDRTVRFDLPVAE